MSNEMKILVINCGSSSLKYQLFLMPKGECLIKGLVEKIGEKSSFLKQERKDSKKYELTENIPDHTAAFKFLIEAMLNKEAGVINSISEINGVGHRVVHGGEKYVESVIITDDVIKDIEEFSDIAPLHNPANLQGIVAAKKLFSKDVKHSATFDTAFHQTIPDYAHLYAIPREFYDKFKIRRYGFHGTSHRYVASAALEYCRRVKDNTNLITVHLGNGCSVTAIEEGKSIDTSMGFTPLEGVIMGTRSGDIDPAIINYLVSKGYDPKEINSILNKKSGLLALSEKSNDMREISEAAANGDKKAKLAMESFAYRVKKYIGAYAAIMVRVDIVVFTGGIGQNSPIIREMICKNLENIGMHIDLELNKKVGNKAGIISQHFSPTAIMVIPTDEELRMAHDAFELFEPK